MKKLCIVLALLLCLLPVLSVSAEEDHPARLVDGADLLTAGEELELADYLDTISIDLNVDVAIVTVTSLDGKTAQEYADDFYDYNGYGMDGNDGILLLVSVDGETRSFAYTTTGAAEDVFSDSAMDRLDAAFLPSLRALEYNDAFWKFAESCNEIIYAVLYTEDGTLPETDTGTEAFLPGFGWVLLSLAIGIVLAFVVMAGYKGALKSVRAQAAANSYVRRGSMQLTMDRDLFLYRTVTATPKPKDRDSNSSSHTGSSGTSHGGRSGSF